LLQDILIFDLCFEAGYCLFILALTLSVQQPRD
jgi:hypothetical protein